MKNWYMLTLVGEDRGGIVAQVTAALYAAGCNLGEASMIRLGGSFTIMLLVEYAGTEDGLRQLLEPVSRSLGLHVHVDGIAGQLHRHVVPDVRITVSGADRAGIVAQVTGALATAGLNILDLASDVAGSDQAPIYVMHIEGSADRGIEALRSAVAPLAAEGIDIRVHPIDTLIG